MAAPTSYIDLLLYRQGMLSCTLNACLSGREHTSHPSLLVEPTMRRVRVEPVPLPPSRSKDEGGPRGDISFRI